MTERESSKTQKPKQGNQPESAAKTTTKYSNLLSAGVYNLSRLLLVSKCIVQESLYFTPRTIISAHLHVMDEYGALLVSGYQIGKVPAMML
jgi:hypothetical protein